MVKDSENHIIKKVTDVKIGETITVDLSDGNIEADVSKINQESGK